jgi:dUTP pyrophosphatase
LGVLSHQQIRDLIQSPTPLVASFRDLETQLQPNGMDLTVQSLARFQDPGRLGTANTDRRLATTEELPFDERGEVYLLPGPYLVTLNEVVHLPNKITALARPRSSLLRSGVAMHNAVWDAGYHGRSQAMLVVYNPHGFTLARDARILQLVFFTLEAATTVPYAGRFQSEQL